MKSRYFYVVVALCLVLMAPVLGGYTQYTVGDGISWLVSYISDWDGVVTADGVWSDPDLTTVIVASNEDIGETDSLLVELGDLSGYREVYVKLLASTWQDSITCKFASSETGGWATGNTAYFDFIPSDADIDHWETGTNTLGTYGILIPLRDAYGAWLPGPNGLLEIENNNIVWDDATDNDLLGVSVIVLKRK